ncbi:MAG TPA: biotin/lipoyl-containing protein [Ktedonobacterales bacterium]
MRYVATIGERQITVEVSESGHVRRVTIDGTEHVVDWQPVGGAALSPGESASAGHYSLLVGTRSYDLFVHPFAGPAADPARGAEQAFEVTVAGLVYLVRLEDERMRALAGMAGTAHERGEVPLTAPMPGMVSQVVVNPGQTVQRGQTLIVLEAMKMENDLAAPRSGVVRDIRVAKGSTVNQGQVLAIVGDPEGAEPPTALEEL